MKALFFQPLLHFQTIGGVLMKIKRAMERIPGGMMVIPLLLGAFINTFFPDLLRIGNFTQQLFVDGSGTLIALFLLCTGAQINLRSFGISLAKGGNPAYCQVGGGGGLRTDRLCVCRAGRSVVGIGAAGDCGGNDQ